MHVLDILLLGGAVVCFVLAYIITSRPARELRQSSKSKSKWNHVNMDSASSVHSPEMMKYVHDKTG